MRLTLPVALLLSLPALPAAANSFHGHGSAGMANHHFFFHHQHFPFHGFHRQNPFWAWNGRGWNGGWGWGWGGPADWGWGWDWNNGAPGAMTAAQPYAFPPPPPQRLAQDERPTVETTATGVTIIRGPGSHHVLP